MKLSKLQIEQVIEEEAHRASPPLTGADKRRLAGLLMARGDMAAEDVLERFIAELRDGNQAAL